MIDWRFFFDELGKELFWMAVCVFTCLELGK